MEIWEVLICTSDDVDFCICAYKLKQHWKKQRGCAARTKLSLTVEVEEKRLG